MRTLDALLPKTRQGILAATLVRPEKAWYASELAQRLGTRAPELVIAPLANAIRGGVRNVDHLFRSDAGEFSVLLPETGIEGARIVVERLRALLREPGLVAPGDLPRIAVAAASFPKESVSDGEALLALARRALL